MFALVPASRRAAPRAFTLIELIVIIVVLAILSGIAIPKYIDYTANAKASVAKATVGSMRSAISNFYASSALTGTPTFPTLLQVQTVGTVMQEALPPNPYNLSAIIAAASWTTSAPISGINGYNYDAALGRFWLNSNTSSLAENLW